MPLSTPECREVPLSTPKLLTTVPPPLFVSHHHGHQHRARPLLVKLQELAVPEQKGGGEGGEEGVEQGVELEVPEHGGRGVGEGKGGTGA